MAHGVSESCWHRLLCGSPGKGLRLAEGGGEEVEKHCDLSLLIVIWLRSPASCFLHFQEGHEHAWLYLPCLQLAPSHLPPPPSAPWSFSPAWTGHCTPLLHIARGPPLPAGGRVQFPVWSGPAAPSASFLAILGLRPQSSLSRTFSSQV